MDPLSLIIAVVAALAGVVVGAVVAVWLFVKPAPVETPKILDALKQSEDRVAGAIAALREANERAAREAAAAQNTALIDLTQKLLKESADTRAQLLEAVARLAGEQQKTQGEQLAALSTRLADGQTTARRELTEALDKQAAAQTSTLAATREALLTGQTTLNNDVAAKLAEVLERVARLSADQQKALAEQLGALARSQAEAREALAATLNQLNESIARQLTHGRDAQAEAAKALVDELRKNLGEVRADNEKRLEQMRATVEEKLQGTLETRLGESFKQVSEQLEKVYKGLGEMQTVAAGVGDLKRVLTNVKARGTFGEVQLGALLEQVLTPGQYERNVATIPGSTERVEFAIKLPGRDDERSTVWLPIDAKFPQEDYLRVQEAAERNDVEALAMATAALRLRLVGEAKRIRSKYVEPPHTTDFAFLFLPTEGLYSEALRMPGLAEALQSDHRIVLAGPTTLLAVLNSLQMGFRTLAIEKRSGEVWKVLGAVKSEFEKFGASLDAVSKKLQEASNKIEDTQKRNRVLARALKGAEALPEAEAQTLLPGIEE